MKRTLSGLISSTVLTLIFGIICLMSAIQLLIIDQYFAASIFLVALVFIVVDFIDDFWYD